MKMRLIGLFLFSTAFVVAASVSHPAAGQTQKLSVEDAVLGRGGELYPDRIGQWHWVPNGGWSHVEDNTLKVNARNGKPTLELSAQTLGEVMGKELKRFPAHTWLAPGSFRFNQGNNWYRFDFKRKAVETLFELPENAENIHFSDDGQRVAWTQDNNVYLSAGGSFVQVTDHPEGVVAGQAIARYEFGIGEGLFWSPDGMAVAFYEKDERHVTTYPLADYSKTPAEHTPIVYPMAGGHSEYASLGVYHIKLRKTVYIDANNGVKDDSYYITNVAWAPDGQSLLAAIVSRDQNTLKLTRFDASTGEVVATLLTETDSKYVEPEKPAIFFPNETGEFLWFSEKSGFNNLYWHTADGSLKAHTKADFAIDEFLGFGPKAAYCVVAGYGPSPVERHIYKVSFPDMAMTKITRQAGTHSAKLAPDGERLLDEWSSLEVPHRAEMVQVTGKIERVLLVSDNPLADYRIGKVELGTLKANDGTDLHYRVVYPPNFDNSRRHPAVVYVYNGPHVQLVTNSWQGGAPLWMHSLAGEGYVVFSIDGRGSANRGKDFEQAIHRRLGTVEVDDQMAGVNWLRSQRFIDDSRMAVHGWSYGGFMTTSLMLKQPGVFKAGIAGGPVIDWNLYEVMYTERYMDSPQDNPTGYEDAQLTRYVDRLQGKLLMIHGTDDDVVVMQHNMRFLTACIEQGKLVDFFVYPGHAHNVRGKDRVHLIKKVFDYIFEHI